ncbi:hypothetical protein DERP_013626 [Dermatophagoides pteronyssinus]|uniref:Uncharacterized protein n=1 Tax=Dermatophagoides pteronyssinus TaxID=6956 RepID=A0ABQ8IPS5_DERPT|nr:hypothetical protein DERP_013626 [Dermatophagoides pteronyssinus]
MIKAEKIPVKRWFKKLGQVEKKFKLHGHGNNLLLSSANYETRRKKQSSIDSNGSKRKCIKKRKKNSMILERLDWTFNSACLNIVDDDNRKKEYI